MSRNIVVIMSILITLLLNGCKVGPNYEPPCMEVPVDWASPSNAVDVRSSDSNWWDQFEDSMLVYYIEKSASCNYDIRIALQNICKARAQCKIRSSYLYPEIDSELRYNRNSFDTFFGGLALEADQDLPNLPSFTTNTDQKIFFTGLDAFWEIDLFGQTRRQVEAACARIGSSVEEYHDILITVFGEVARNYFEIRGLQQNIKIVERKIRNLTEYLELIKEKNSAGITSVVDVNDIAAQLEDQKSALPSLISDLYTNIYRLSFLVGEYPYEILDELKMQMPLPSIPLLVNTGVPSELLLRRPDIRKAERELAAATADVGAAIADYFPKINLAASIGNQKFNSAAFKDNGFVWSYTGDLLSPLFKAGRITANVKSRKADANIAYLRYQKSVLQAIGESESAIVSYTMSLNNYSFSQKRYSEHSKIADLKSLLYEKGIDSRLNYLDAQNKALESESSLVRNQTDALVKVVTLYKSLGGGWEVCFD